MKKELLPTRESLVYPGQYLPNCELCELQSNAKDKNEARSPQADFVLEEHPDHFMIEIPAPGITRENIFVSAQGDIISVFIKDIHRKQDDFLKYHIHLQKPFDTGFISATYYKGLLHVYVPKAIGACDINNQDVVVY